MTSLQEVFFVFACFLIAVARVLVTCMCIFSVRHLPVIIDPSHSTGSARLVEPLSMGATAMCADGLIIEVHNNPPCALCDGAQSQTPEMFAGTMKKIAAIRPHAWKGA